MLQDNFQSETEFYLMKIARLESDLTAAQEELMGVRLRLRTADDFQIKYQLLLKQLEQENYRLQFGGKEDQSRINEIINARLSERDEYWSEKLAAQEATLSSKYQSEIESLREGLVSSRKKSSRKSIKFQDDDLIAFKNKKLLKEKQALEEKIEEMKIGYKQSKQDEIKSIKESLLIKNREKQETERRIYREKIDDLERKINGLEQALLEAKRKADPEREKEIERLKKEISEKTSLGGMELQRISASFSHRNQEMGKLLEERYRVEEQLMREKKELRELIKTLQDRIFDKEKEHEIELIGLKEKMGRIRENEAMELKDQIGKNEENFQVERKSWDTVIEDKEAEVSRVVKKAEEDSNRHKEDKAKQLTKISDLKERVKELQREQQAGGAENLRKSLKDLESREAEHSNYENGVTFLDRQLKKAILKVEQKNIEVSKLIKQLNSARQEYEAEMGEVKERARQDKKYYLERINTLENKIRELTEVSRAKEKDHIKNEKSMEAEINRQKVETKSLREMVDEMQRDYNRLAESKKQVVSSYRDQRDKGLTSKSDLTLAKKQKWLELERQKNQLEVIFKEREEQLRNGFESERQDLRRERDKLRADFEIQRVEFEAIKREKDESATDDIKENIYGEYHKKMSTLNLQIALTKNIYNSLVEAKARTKKVPLEEMEEVMSNSVKEEDGMGEMKIKISSPQLGNVSHGLRSQE